MKKYTFEDSRTVELFEELKCGVIHSDMWVNFISGEIDNNEERRGFCIHIYGPNTPWKRCHMGKYENGNREGYGIYYWPNGTVYMGDFVKGEFNGFGVVIQPSGLKIIGQFEPEKEDGIRGIFSPYLKSGTWYIDDSIVDHKELGFDDRGFKRVDNKELWIDGTYYEGNFKDGKYHGYGRLVLEKSLYYEGDFFNGKMQGEGTYYYGNSGKMEGTFFNNDLSGKGFIKFDNDLGYYDGEVERNRPCGKGTLNWKGKEISGIFNLKSLSENHATTTTSFVCGAVEN